MHRKCACRPPFQAWPAHPQSPTYSPPRHRPPRAPASSCHVQLYAVHTAATTISHRHLSSTSCQHVQEALLPVMRCSRLKTRVHTHQMLVLGVATVKMVLAFATSPALALARCQHAACKHLRMWKGPSYTQNTTLPPRALLSSSACRCNRPTARLDVSFIPGCPTTNCATLSSWKAAGCSEKAAAGATQGAAAVHRHEYRPFKAAKGNAPAVQPPITVA